MHVVAVREKATAPPTLHHPPGYSIDDAIPIYHAQKTHSTRPPKQATVLSLHFFTNYSAPIKTLVKTSDGTKRAMS